MTCPGTSRRRATGLRDRGTTRITMARAASPPSALAANTARQSSQSTMAPPITGPRPVPMPADTPQMPMARARSRGSG
jgi:hypothetical protein